MLDHTEYVVKSKTNVLGSGTSNPAGELHINGSWLCNGQDLMSGRINLRKSSNNTWVLWTGDSQYDVFECVSE